MRHIVIICVFFAALIFPVGRRAEAAASFDCKVAATAVESLICGDRVLGNEDFALSANYKRVIELSAKLPIDRQKLLADQREWLRSRARICSSTGKTAPIDPAGKFKAVICLVDMYKARENSLQQMTTEAEQEFGHLPPSPTAEVSTRDIVKEEDLRDIVQRLQDDGLKNYFPTMPATIGGCDTPVEYVVQQGGHDSSYGAHCKLRVGDATVDVLMCNDYLVGKFDARLSGATPSRDSVVQFIGSMCPPGG